MGKEGVVRIFINEPNVRIACRNLWKVFGADPEKIIRDFDDYDPSISKTELLKKTGCVIGVRDADFTINEGEIFVVMGLSGSGKSTLLRLINRLHEPTQGRVFIDGEDITAVSQNELREIRRKKTGMVFQSFALLPHRRVIDNVEFGLDIQGVEKSKRRRKAREMLELVGLKGWERSYPRELSGGMKQRVGLARALAVDPEILLMDEAFSALDPLIRRQMQNEFINLIRIVNKTIVFVTHDLQEALRLADRIAIMKFGAIVQMGTPEEIVLHPETDYVAEFVKDLPKMKFITAHSIMLEPDRWIVDERKTVSSIVKRMDDRNLWYMFVVDGSGRIKGAVNYRDLTDVHADPDKPPRNGDLIDSYPTASLKTFMEELPGIAAKKRIPIAVLDDERRVKGIITREHLLDAISRKEELEQKEIHE